MAESPLKTVGVLNAQSAVVANHIDNLNVQSGTGWIEVDFADQRSIAAALRGDSMGPADVYACPQLPEVEEVLRRLRTSRAVVVNGRSGCGKSMVAWHAASVLHRDGWRVFTPCGFITSLPALGPDNGVLLVDDAQNGLSLSAALAHDRLFMIVVSTDPVAGFRARVQVDPKRAVQHLATALLGRTDELLPILRDHDAHVGDKAFETSVEWKIRHAAEARYPWQFMFNLGSGHLRINNVLERFTAADPIRDVLFAVAVRQLSTRDSGCALDWLHDRAREWRYDDLDYALQAISAEIPLLRTDKTVWTPHPLVAKRIVSTLFWGADGNRRRELFWAQFTDETAPLGGIAWLLEDMDLRIGAGRRLRDGLGEVVVARCLHSADRRGAGWALDALISPRILSVESLDPYIAEIRRWIEEGQPDSAVALSHIINAFINAEYRRDPETGDDKRAPRRYARELCDDVDPKTVADWVSTTSIDTAFPLGALLERLATGATSEWCDKLTPHIDADLLHKRLVDAAPNQIYGVAEITKAVYIVDQQKGVLLAQSLAPALAGAINHSPLDGWHDAGDIYRLVLGYIAPFLRGGRDPTPKQKAAARTITRRVDVAVIAAALARSRRRDWHSWKSPMAFFREADPDLAVRIAGHLDVDAAVQSIAPMAKSPSELDEALVALALTDSYEPAATIVRRVSANTTVLGWRAVAIAPDVAPDFLARGGEISLGLGGGLPRWTVAAGTMARVYGESPKAAAAMLRQQITALSDGLLLKQIDSVDGLVDFVQLARHIDPDAVLQAIARIDHAAASKSWPARVAGGGRQREGVATIARMAQESEGPISSLAREIVATVATMGIAEGSGENG